MAQWQSQMPQNRAEVLQIPDLKTAMLILKDMGVMTKGKGIQNKDDAVSLIMENFDRGAVLPPKQVKVREVNLSHNFLINDIFINFDIMTIEWLNKKL